MDGFLVRERPGFGADDAWEYFAGFAAGYAAGCVETPGAITSYPMTEIVTVDEVETFPLDETQNGLLITVDEVETFALDETQNPLMVAVDEHEQTRALRSRQRPCKGQRQRLQKLSMS